MGEHRGRRIAGVVAALALVAGAGWWAGLRGPSAGGTSNAGSVPLGTARVLRTDLTDTIQVGGALGYAGGTTVVAQRGGVVTALPAVGQVVARGQTLYEVDGRGVPLCYGTRPQWRPLAAGVTAGPDVAELNANLAALGYGAPPGDAFLASTGLAIDRWQAAQGLPQTGSVAPGDVAYALGPLRVEAVTPSLGAPIQPGAPVLTATSTSLVVTAQVPVSQVRLVKAGDAVSVTMPDGHSREPGVVTAVSPVATNPTDRSTNEPTIATTIALDHASDTGNLDQAPVEVDIDQATATGALAVPVNALVALAGGGYAVQVPDGAAEPRLVGVTTGLFAGSLVQVTGTGIDAGTAVVVPSS